MHRYASSSLFFLYSRILLTFQADQTPLAVSSLGMLLRSPFDGTLCLLLCYRRYSSQPGHCDCELLAALLSVVSRGIFTETSRQPTEPLSVRPLHAPRAALPPPLSRSDPSDRCAYCSAPAVPALCSAPRRTRCSPCSPEPLRGSLPRSAPRFRTPRSP